MRYYRPIREVRMDFGIEPNMKKLLTIELEEGELVSLLPTILALNADFRVRTVVTVNAEGGAYPAAAANVANNMPVTRKMQKRTPDGRTSRQVVTDKVASFGTKKFHIREVDSVARFTGFAAGTLRPQLQALVREGLVEKVGRHYFRAVPVPPTAPVPVAETPATEEQAA